MRFWALLVVLLGAGVEVRAALPFVIVGAEPGCPAAILSAERDKKLPIGLLGAIAMVESGRPDPHGGRAAPWPWTINVAGIGLFFESKQQAIAAVITAQLAGTRSIDVGCMQVNLMHHPDAFATLEDAFDPQANAFYAAGFLNRLFEQTGSWPEAAASYHSSTPGLREDYQRRVMQDWGGVPHWTAASGGPRSRAGTSTHLNETPALRAQLAESRSDHARWAAMGLVRTAPSTPILAQRRTRLARLADARLPGLSPRPGP